MRNTRKWFAALIIGALLALMTALPAFAIMDANVPADDRSGNSVGGAAVGSVNDEGGQSPPIHDTNENTTKGLP